MQNRLQAINMLTCQQIDVSVDPSIYGNYAGMQHYRLFT